MKKCRRLGLLMGIWLLFPMQMFGVIAKPGSGVYGDEHYHYRLDSTGRIYAPIRERQRPKRLPQIQSTFPTKGDVRSLVILVEYQDVSFSVANSQQAFYDMLNKEGYSENGGTGSARDYFLSSSNNLFRPTFDVYGPIKLPENRAFYGGGNGQASHYVQMVIDACDILDETIDWSLYDVNKDGTIDNIFVYYAGHNEAEGGPEESVWPHRAYIYSESEGTTIRYYYEVNGKRYWLWDYACTSELTGESGVNMCGIGTFCHEFSHVLGLDDLYNTTNITNYTIGTWDIMSSGNYNNDGRTPPSYSAFERFLLGWITPEQLLKDKDCVLEPLETTFKAYLMSADEHNMNAKNPSPKEYWLIENRQKVGWDAPEGCLPGTGLLITHITWDQHRWDYNTPNNSKPFLYDICEAWYSNPYMSTPTDTYPGLFKVTDFFPVNNNNDTLFAHQLHSIRVVSDINVAFHHGSYSGSGFTMTPSEPKMIHTYFDIDRIINQEVVKLEIEGEKIQDTVVAILSENPFLELSLDSSVWVKDTIWVKPLTDSSYTAQLFVRFAAVKQCDYQEGDVVVQTRDGAQSFFVPIKAESLRPTFITDVVANEAKDITPYSFIAQWETQEDAEQYELVVYRLIDKTSAYSFKPQLRMSSNGTSYTTDNLYLPVQSLEFTIEQSYNSAKNDYRGYVLVDGWNGEQWQRIDSLSTRSTNYTINKTYSFTDDKNYLLFRFVYGTIQDTHSVTLKTVNIVCGKQPAYVFNDTAMIVNASMTEAEVKDLLPQTKYYYYLTCSEEKGCENHRSERGNTISVTTKTGSVNSNHFSVQCTKDKVTAYLTAEAEDNSSLNIYDATGKILFTIPLSKGETTINIPVNKLTSGQIYLVKYMIEGKLNGKSLWAKFVY